MGPWQKANYYTNSYLSWQFGTYSHRHLLPRIAVLPYFTADDHYREIPANFQPTKWNRHRRT
ncbi:hypothetical protein OSTOST_06425, partial [Ostertagia ostertagi]